VADAAEGEVTKSPATNREETIPLPPTSLPHLATQVRREFPGNVLEQYAEPPRKKGDPAFKQDRKPTAGSMTTDH